MRREQSDGVSMQPKGKSYNFQRTARTGGSVSGTRTTNRWFFVHQLIAPNTSSPGTHKDAVESVSPLDKQKRVEAALFLSSEGLSSRKLAKLAGLADATEARTLIRRINLSLDEDGRSYRIEEVAGGYAMMTRSQFAPWLRRLAHVPGAVKLSQSAMETLAVVAYRQPVLRANVEAIRGVGCSEVLKQLMDLDLIRISGRSEELGRPYLYGTTRRFLQMFGLRSADRLPRIEWVNQTQLATKELVDSDSETKESIVKMSFADTPTFETDAIDRESSLLHTRHVVAAIDDEDEDFEDDEVDDDDDFDDDEDWDDDDDDVDDEDDDDDIKEDLDEEELEEDDLDDDDDGGWEEVDDDDDLDDDDDDEDDDWEDDDDEDDDWD
jgi:segregation and condensation protein B